MYVLFLIPSGRALSLSLVVGAASSAYGTFYWLYMPGESHHLPLNLQFQPCSTLQQNTQGWTKCSFPTGQVEMPDLAPGTPHTVTAQFVFQVLN